MPDLQELEKLPIISLEKNTSTRTYMDQFLLKNRVKMHPEFELATSDMIVQFTKRNLGIGSRNENSGIRSGRRTALHAAPIKIPAKLQVFEIIISILLKAGF